MTDKKPKKSAPHASAIHLASSDGSKHLVYISSLKVMIEESGSFWFAQGLDIDYCAQGKSLEEVKKLFASGLRATINEHLTVYGCIDNLLEVAPAEVWEQFYSKTAQGIRARHTQASVHDMLPFSEIEYLEMKSEQAIAASNC